MRIKTPEERGVDSWMIQGEGGIWKRAHRTPRRALFTPHRVAGGPSKETIIKGRRVTNGTYVGNKERFTITDDYNDPNDAHKILKNAWIGTTEFEVLDYHDGEDKEDASKVIGTLNLLSARLPPAVGGQLAAVLKSERRQGTAALSGASCSIERPGCQVERVQSRPPIAIAMRVVANSSHMVLEADCVHHRCQSEILEVSRSACFPSHRPMSVLGLDLCEGECEIRDGRLYRSSHSYDWHTMIGRGGTQTNTEADVTSTFGSSANAIKHCARTPTH